MFSSFTITANELNKIHLGQFI